MKKIIAGILLAVMLLGVLTGCKFYIEIPDATKNTTTTQDTEATDTTEATDATEVTEVTEATEATQATDATEATEATESVEDDPDTILADARRLSSGTSLPSTATLTGKITAIRTPWSDETQKIVLRMQVQGKSSIITCNLGEDPADKLKVDDVITVTGTIRNDGGTVGFAYGSVIEDWQAELRYSHLINEDFDLGGSLLVFGSDITTGFCVSEQGEEFETTPYSTHLWNRAQDISTFDNRAASGTFVCDTENKKSIYNRVMALNSFYSTILIAECGTNDFLWGKPLGNPSDTEPISFYGCLDSMCKFLKENYPKSNVVFMTTLVDEDFREETRYSSANGYSNAVHEVARRYGFNVVEGSHLGFSGKKNALVSDGIYITEAGHEYLARKLHSMLGKKAKETTRPTQPTESTEPTQPEATAQDAINALKDTYKDSGSKTPTDYTRYGLVVVYDTLFDVAWSTNVSEDVVKIQINQDKTVTIDVNEAYNADVTYVLTATVTDAKGQKASYGWNYILPKSS